MIKDNDNMGKEGLKKTQNKEVKMAKRVPKEGLFFIEDDIIARNSVKNKPVSGKLPDFINKILEGY